MAKDVHAAAGRRDRCQRRAGNISVRLAREERAAIAAARRGRPIPASAAYHRFVEKRQGQLSLPFDRPDDDPGTPERQASAP
jgi:hypothetical protein